MNSLVTFMLQMKWHHIVSFFWTETNLYISQNHYLWSSHSGQRKNVQDNESLQNKCTPAISLIAIFSELRRDCCGHLQHNFNSAAILKIIHSICQWQVSWNKHLSVNARIRCIENIKAMQSSYVTYPGWTVPWALIMMLILQCIFHMPHFMVECW